MNSLITGTPLNNCPLTPSASRHYTSLQRFASSVIALHAICSGLPREVFSAVEIEMLGVSMVAIDTNVLTAGDKTSVDVSEKDFRKSITDLVTEVFNAVHGE
jgi:hypothetical protein